MAPQIEAVTEPVLLGESPHWDQHNQVLYFISFLEGTVNKYVPSTNKHTRAKIDDMVTFIVPVEGKLNHFVVGAKNKVLEIQWSGDGEANVLRTITEVENDKPKNTLNDGKADPRGRLFTGTKGPFEAGKIVEKQGSLYRIEPDGRTHKIDENIDLSNGLCWDEKEKAFYYADSLEYAIRRYDYDIETGCISNPRLIFKFKEQGVDGFPDGMTVDTDGNLWVANFHGNVLKIDPKSGKLLDTIKMPVQEITSMAFGGESMDILYVTTGHARSQPGGATYQVTGLGVKGTYGVKVKLDN